MTAPNGTPSPLLIRGARVLRLSRGPRPRRGPQMADLAVMDPGDVLIDPPNIVAVGEDIDAPGDIPVLHAEGRVLMPGFVDCHTHACWAGDRIDEWTMRLGGADYLEILQSGGGIMSTVHAVRAATEEGLIASLRHRLDAMLHHGTTTAEVKSGYGLTTDAELKMLRAITRAYAPCSFPYRRTPPESEPRTSPTVVPTALLGHAIDPEIEGFIDAVCSETLPAVHNHFPDITIDAFCEKGAWSYRDTLRLLMRARELGHSVRVHVDQFNSLGLLPDAAKLGAVSVDHLEASTKTDLDILARTDTFGVILPCCGVHVDGRFANMRRFVSAGGLLALATNFNPGSAPCPSMPMAIALATRFCGITHAEAIVAATINPATLLGFNDRGAIVPGLRADLLLLRHDDERMLAYEFGADPVETVILGGRIVKGPAPAVS